jgi:hypothetical protein
MLKISTHLEGYFIAYVKEYAVYVALTIWND